MSYNIDHWKTKKIENLEILLESIPEGEPKPWETKVEDKLNIEMPPMPGEKKGENNDE